MPEYMARKHRSQDSKLKRDFNVTATVDVISVHGEKQRTARVQRRNLNATDANYILSDRERLYRTFLSILNSTKVNVIPVAGHGGP
jgi:hypothetical protein